MSRRSLIILTAAALLAACATAKDRVNPVTAMYGGDPADPAATEAPFVPPDDTLAGVPAPAGAPSDPHRRPSSTEQSQHSMGGQMPDAAAGSEHRHVDDGTGSETSDSYRCPMHPEESSTEPGRCSRCGMELVREEDE